mmetsp:Transcript_56497/g.120182  ORF Transcript_56497/g.120182 Transcript_56497/m.120182 type:complete len:103 (-) Transcript_56497:158-466(-)
MLFQLSSERVSQSTYFPPVVVSRSMTQSGRLAIRPPEAALAAAAPKLQRAGGGASAAAAARAPPVDQQTLALCCEVGVGERVGCRSSCRCQRQQQQQHRQSF